MNHPQTKNKHGLLGRRFPFRRKPAKVACRPTRRLLLERLEDRRLLTGDITYKIANYPVNQSDFNQGGTDTVSGTIETDGTIGTITAANIIAASFTISGISTTSATIGQSSGLQATSTELLIPQGGAFQIDGLQGNGFSIDMTTKTTLAKALTCQNITGRLTDPEEKKAIKSWPPLGFPPSTRKKAPS